MSQKEDIAALKAEIESLKARVFALECRPYGYIPSWYPQPCPLPHYPSYLPAPYWGTRGGFINTTAAQ